MYFALLVLFLSVFLLADESAQINVSFSNNRKASEKCSPNELCVRVPMVAFSSSSGWNISNVLLSNVSTTLRKVQMFIQTIFKRLLVRANIANDIQVRCSSVVITKRRTTALKRAHVYRSEARRCLARRLNNRALRFEQRNVHCYLSCTCPLHTRCKVKKH